MATTKTPPRHPILRWVKRVLLGIVGLVILAVGGAFAALHTDWGHEILRQQVEKQLNGTFTGGATLGKLEGSPFGELVLDQLVINGPDGKPAIQVGALHLQISLMPLLASEVKLDHVALDDLDVTLKRNPDGTLQIGQLTKPGPPSKWNIVMPDVEVHRGHVNVDTGAADPAQRIVDIDALQIDAAAKIPHEGALNATAVIHALVRQRAATVDLAVMIRNDEEAVSAPAALVAVNGIGVALGDFRLSKGDQTAFSGLVAANAPMAEVAKLVPGVELPDDVAVSAFVSPVAIRNAGAADEVLGPEERISLFGQLGPTPLRGFITGDIAKKSGHGVLITGNFDAGKLSKGAVTGTGGAVVTFDATAPAVAGELPVATAMITGWGAVAGTPPLTLAIALTTDAEHVRTIVGADTPGALVGLGATIHKKGDAITLEAARLVAGARDPAKLSTKSPPIYGSLHANLSASGELKPTPNLAVAGMMDGEHLKFNDLTIASLQFHVDGKQLPSAPLGTARLVIAGLDKGPSVSLETVTIAAANRPDHSIQVGIRTRPRARPWLVDADAIVTLGQTTVVQLTHHHVRAGATDWTGTTGRFEIGPTGYKVTNLRTASAKGELGLDASYQHTATSGRITLAADAAIATAGTAKVALDLDAPAVIGDLAAWGRMPRAALRKGEIIVDADFGKAAQLAAVQGVSGTLDAKIEITPTDIAGTIDLRKLMAPALTVVGQLTAHVDLNQKGNGDFSTAAVAKFDGIGQVHLTAAFDTPDRPFDVAAWKKLDRTAFKGAQLKLDEVTLDTALFDALHTQSELRGKVDFTADVPAGMPSAALALDVHALRGGPIARPIDMHLEAKIDATDTTAAFHAATKSGDLVTLDAKLPLTLAALIADPAAAKATQVAVTMTVPTVPAANLLATFGRNDITAGTVGGVITVNGTIGKPTVTAKLQAKDLQVPPGLGSTQPQVMRELALDASWDGAAGKVSLTGNEANGGTLAITAAGSPTALADVTADLEAKKFDVRTLTAFAPGVVGAIIGQLDGKITLKGLDPRTMDVGGKLVFTAARLPIAPTIGTLRQANITLAIDNKVIKIDGSGKLGRNGTIKLVAEAPLANGAPTGGKATLTLRQVQPIGAVQPLIDSDINATIERKNDSWAADVHVTKTLVKITDEKGQALDPVGPPTDMIYGKQQQKNRALAQKAKTDPTQKAPPPHPILTAKVDLGTVTVESADARGAIKGRLDVSIGEAPVGGSPVGVTGDINVQRGNVELFDRRYEIDHAALHFDGSTDPQLDVRITYDFPDVTTVTEVHGRLSKPELNLSSEPGIYSQGELLGFLLGGEPNGDTQQSQSAAARVSGAGTSFLANQVGGYVKKALPVSIDVIKYEAASTANSAAVTVGSWVTHTLFLAYREHLDARPDENAGEGDIEYYIKPRIVLQGTAGDRGYDGLDLLWRRRW